MTKINPYEPPASRSVDDKPKAKLGGSFYDHYVAAIAALLVSAGAFWLTLGGLMTLSQLISNDIRWSLLILIAAVFVATACGTYQYRQTLRTRNDDRAERRKNGELKL